MLDLKSKRTIESQTEPGVKFTVKALNVIARAKRDASVADHRLEYTRIHGELSALRASLIGEDGTEEEKRGRFDALSDADKLRLGDLVERQERIYSAHILPATIKAGLVAIEGLMDDGKPVTTAEALLETAPDHLLAEVADACSAASGLSEERKKNLQ